MATAADTKDDTAATGSAAENMDFLEGEDYSSIADPLALVSPDGAQFDLFVKRIRSLMEEGKLQYLVVTRLYFGTLFRGVQATSARRLDKCHVRSQILDAHFESSMEFVVST